MLEVGKCYQYNTEKLLVYITDEDDDFYYCNHVTDAVYYHDRIHKQYLDTETMKYYQEIAFSVYALAVMKEGS